MNAWRNTILARRRLAFLLAAIVLFAKILVPTGYMFTPGGNGIVVQLCSGQGMTPVVLNIQKDAPAPAEHHPASGKADAPCAFSGVGMASLVAIDAVLLVGAIAFVMALGTQRVSSVAVRFAARIRPPSRAPPTFA
jgi:hypothetical protein